MTYTTSVQEDCTAKVYHDSKPIDPIFAHAVLTGLSSETKALPSEYFYDKRGSQLFEDITKVEEYYPTRTEIGILRECAAEIASRTPPDTVLIEYGSGASVKTEILLKALPNLAAYIPVDVSQSALKDAKHRLKQRYPDLCVLTRVADFREPVELPANLLEKPRLGFFPGSTIGNFRNDEAKEILHRLATNLGPENRLILGVDLVKEKDKLERAYNDQCGVTAEFNLNLLARINRELAGTFDVDAFSHVATYDEKCQRINMYLRSEIDQDVHILGQNISFDAGEKIHTEYSHKYTIKSAGELTEGAGFQTADVWTDKNDLFSVHDLVVR